MIPKGTSVLIDRTEPGTGGTLRRALDMMDDLVAVLKIRGDGFLSVMDGSALIRAKLPQWPEILQVQVPTSMTPRMEDMDDADFAVAIVESFLETMSVVDGDAASEAIEAHRGRAMALLEAAGIDIDDPLARDLSLYAPTPWADGGQSLHPVSSGGRMNSIRPVPPGPSMLVVHASLDTRQYPVISVTVGGHFEQGVPPGPISRLRAAAAWQRHVASLGSAAA